MIGSLTPQPACRSNQHCVYFGFCHRCSADLSRQALSILATLRERLGDEQRVAKAYLAVTSALAEAVLDTPADRGVNHWADKSQAVAPGAHVYLSTGCLHGRHDYCANREGQCGPKKPASCKFCAAPCQCPCHAQPEEQQ